MPGGSSSDRLTTSGRAAGSGSTPDSSVGASRNSAAAHRSGTAHPEVSHALAATQVAPGATPMAGSPGPPPTSRPMVAVP